MLVPLIDLDATQPAVVATAPKNALVRRAIYKKRLEQVVMAIEDAQLWCDGEEFAIMRLLVDAKDLLGGVS